MNFWVCENWSSGMRAVIIQAGRCGFCERGRGRSGKGTKAAYGRWLGP